MERPPGRPREDRCTELVEGPVPLDMAGADPDVVASSQTVNSHWCAMAADEE